MLYKYIMQDIYIDNIELTVGDLSKKKIIVFLPVVKVVKKIYAIIPVIVTLNKIIFLFF